jgi:hypothetical protein
MAKGIMKRASVHIPGDSLLRRPRSGHATVSSIARLSRIYSIHLLIASRNVNSPAA